ncbi:glutamate racemase [Rhizobiales bacterium]|uniref:glutamate racemase n=1 Tax=Hongsoonwoonella zoysiae TaxID=2821844 RepID=UPI0015604889|nr:glutamate racemase [Hongsoonwoonella zoysiae]NRG18048.1 glutamate racemase [Hongsoonwoonella zoysiae]
MSENRPVLIVDSGIGGLSVTREVRALLPGLSIVYLADFAAFPYGDWDEAALADHVVALTAGHVAEHDPCAVVIACNTASTLVLPGLRAKLDIPVVGTVPAVKPAAERTKSGLVSILATPGTVKRDYTFDLIRQFAPDVAVTLVGATGLARIAEDKLAGRPVDSVRLAAEIVPCFREKAGRRTDTIVLGCTHYPFLLEDMRALAPWDVDWIDPAPAIARRLAAVIEGPDASAERFERYISTGGEAFDYLPFIGENPHVF